jgi:hypothetical protein
MYAAVNGRRRVIKNFMMLFDDDDDDANPYSRTRMTRKVHSGILTNDKKVGNWPTHVQRPMRRKTLAKVYERLTAISL